MHISCFYLVVTPLAFIHQPTMVGFIIRYVSFIIISSAIDTSLIHNSLLQCFFSLFDTIEFTQTASFFRYV